MAPDDKRSKQTVSTVLFRPAFPRWRVCQPRIICRPHANRRRPDRGHFRSAALDSAKLDIGSGALIIMIINETRENLWRIKTSRSFIIPFGNVSISVRLAGSARPPGAAEYRTKEGRKTNENACFRGHTGRDGR